MTFLADMVVEINVLEGKEFIMYCACSAMDSMIISGFFLYVDKCSIDLVPPLSILMFHFDVG